MSHSSYKGDSPGKKVTRLRLWLNIRAMCQALELPYAGTLVLAGEGGDLSVLKGMGTDLSTVVAIDYDPFLIEWCSELYPQVIAMVGEAGEMSDVADYNTAHLDFCGGLRNPMNITTFAKVAHNVQTHPSLIAVTMQKCREGLAAGNLIDVPRPVQKALLAEAQRRNDFVGAHIFRGNRFDSRFVLNHSEARLRQMLPPSPITKGRGFYTSKGALGNLGHALVRADAMRWCAEWLMTAWTIQKRQEPIVIRLVGAYTYHSSTRYNQGQAYVSALYVVVPLSKEPAVMQSLKKVRVQRFDSWDSSTCLTGLKPTALDMLNHMSEAKVAQMLDIERVRLASWKEEGTNSEPLISVENLIEIPWLGFNSRKVG